MQAEYENNIFGPVEVFDEKELLKYLDEGAKKVSVFKTGTPEHKKALRQYSKMTKNQKKQFRRDRRKSR